MIKRILVGLGGTPFTPGAIKHAVELAVELDAELTGVTLTHAAEKVDADAALEVLYSSRQAELQDVNQRIEKSVADFNEACRVAGLSSYKVVRETGKIFSKLIEESLYHDLIVFGLKKVLHYDFHAGSPHNLLVEFMVQGVRPLIAVGQTYRRVSRVLIAYSGSMESAKSMKRFVDMRLFPAAAMKIVHFGDTSDTAKMLLQNAAGYCAAHDFNVETEAFDAPIQQGLSAEIDRWKADMVVIGISNKRVFLRKILGDTALQIISESKVPLFVCQ